MPYYHFPQNNSGGQFEFNPELGLTNHVVINAESAEKANEKLRSIGGYFYGVKAGIDCSCCGDRWCPVNERDATATPKVYNFKLGEKQDTIVQWMPDGREIAVHSRTGKIMWFNADLTPAVTFQEHEEEQKPLDEEAAAAARDAQYRLDLIVSGRGQPID